MPRMSVRVCTVRKCAFVQTCRQTVYSRPSCLLFDPYWTHADTHSHTHTNKHNSMLQEAQQHPQLNLKVRTTMNVHYFIRISKDTVCVSIYISTVFFIIVFKSVIMDLPSITNCLILFLCSFVLPTSPLSLR